MTLLDRAPSFRLSRGARGFTLIELMIVVAIVAILAKVALPAYMGYVLRASLQDGVQALSADRVKMEQYFMDNRTYSSPTVTGTPCGSGPVGTGNTISEATTTSGKFTISCAINTETAQPYLHYTITATGNGSASGFVYTIDQSNNMKSTISKAGWPTSCSNWATRPADCTP